MPQSILSQILCTGSLVDALFAAEIGWCSFECSLVSHIIIKLNFSLQLTTPKGYFNLYIVDNVLCWCWWNKIAICFISTFWLHEQYFADLCTKLIFSKAVFNSRWELEPTFWIASSIVYLFVGLPRILDAAALALWPFFLVVDMFHQWATKLRSKIQCAIKSSFKPRHCFDQTISTKLIYVSPLSCLGIVQLSTGCYHWSTWTNIE